MPRLLQQTAFSLGLLLCRGRVLVNRSLCSKYSSSVIGGCCPNTFSPSRTLYLRAMSPTRSESNKQNIQNGVDTLAVKKLENGVLTKPSDRLIWVDLEMTGLDFVNDRILEIACLVTEGDLQIVAEGPHIIIHESEEVLNNMGEWCKEQHGKSGLMEAVRNSKISLREAEQMILNFVRQHTPRGMCPLAGNTIGMDRSFILTHMSQFSEHLHYRVVDVSTVKELCRRWFPEEFKKAPVKKDNHRAMDDILESIAELKFYRSTVFK